MFIEALGTSAQTTGDNRLPVGFFAYSSLPPSIPETITAAIQAINKTQTASLHSWEELQINGKYVISEICDAIDHCGFFCADVTAVNPNVMFEIGYAIATNKRVWLIRDETYYDAKKEFEQLRLLTTIGYSPYVNSEEIIKSFFNDNPHLTLTRTIFAESIEPLLSRESGHLLYLKSRHDTESSVRITRTLENAQLPLIINDPKETNIQPLYWFAQQLWGAQGLVTHYLSHAREGFRIHNARYALVSGLARGFGIKTLMLTEQSDMLAPIDYRDSLQYYTTQNEASLLTEAWLQPITKVHQQTTGLSASFAQALRLATELKDFHLQLGDYIAENEATHLSDYFIETTVTMDLLNGTQAVFVGRKGTGKTANLLYVESIKAADPNNLVCLIKPVGYEIEGLVRLFSGYKIRDNKGYVIESLWKYMLYTELARAAVKQITEQTVWDIANEETKELIDLLEDDKQAFGGEFIVRLERIVKSLEIIPTSESAETFHKGISEALHIGALAKLRTVLARVLSKKREVLLLIDNLDKPWTRNTDLEQLADFLLGLLTATNRIGDELNRGDRGRGKVRFNSAIFLRSDIFEKVIAAAREPDKLAYTRIRWEDSELLLRVIEERYVTSHGPGSDPSTMWRKYFCPQVKGIPTRDYLTSRILRRPRDIVYFVKAVVSFAVNRKHDRVEEKDIVDGEKQYSQYALDSILVENGITVPELESVLFEFIGNSAILSKSQVIRQISRANIPPEQVDGVIDHLVRLSFLGVEVADQNFSYSDEPRELKKNRVLSDRFLDGNEEGRRYEINPPFRSYLEIVEQ
jgi:hypothetical protein